jgi:hypothetical protein
MHLLAWSHPGTAAGARTFLSAAVLNVNKRADSTDKHPEAAADRNVRAPGLAAGSRRRMSDLGLRLAPLTHVRYPFRRDFSEYYWWTRQTGCLRAGFHAVCQFPADDEIRVDSPSLH